MFSPGSQEKQDTLWEQNSEVIFISIGPEGIFDPEQLPQG